MTATQKTDVWKNFFFENDTDFVATLSLPPSQKFRALAVQKDLSNLIDELRCALVADHETALQFAIACFGVYVQANYTGPAPSIPRGLFACLETDEVDKIARSVCHSSVFLRFLNPPRADYYTNSIFFEYFLKIFSILGFCWLLFCFFPLSYACIPLKLQKLEADGETAYVKCEFPLFLLVSRIILVDALPADVPVADTWHWWAMRVLKVNGIFLENHPRCAFADTCRCFEWTCTFCPG